MTQLPTATVPNAIDFASDAEMAAVSIEDVRRMIRHCTWSITYHNDNAAFDRWRATHIVEADSQKYYADRAADHEQKGRDFRLMATFLHASLREVGRIDAAQFRPFRRA